MNDWKEYKLEQLAEVLSSKRIFYKDYVDDGIPFYRSKEIIEKSEGKTIDNPLFITDEKFQSIKSKYGAPSDGDILISSVGMRSGIPYLVNNDGNFYFKDGNLIWLRNFNEKFHSEYFCYWIKSNLGQFSLQNIMIGSAQPALTISGLRGLEITMPTIVEQKAIASVLSSLDDKIDLLHRQNKTLEGMAEVLFREWFVEKQKEEWEEISLYDAIVLVGGGTPKTSVEEYWNGNINWLSGGDIAGNHKNFVATSDKYITELGLKNSSTKLLPKLSTVISARGTVGKFCLLSKPMTFSQSNYGIKPKFKNCYFFTYLLISHSVEELLSAAYGSVFDTITTNTFKEHSISIPTPDEITMFENQVKPLFDKMLNNTTQIQTLEKLRDTLLPKLMSGEVRVEIQ